MSLLIKLRNILYILRIFYWMAFKAVVKGYCNGSVHLYPFIHLELKSSGPKKYGLSLGLSYSSAETHKK